MKRIYVLGIILFSVVGCVKQDEPDTSIENTYSCTYTNYEAYNESGAAIDISMLLGFERDGSLVIQTDIYEDGIVTETETETTAYKLLDYEKSQYAFTYSSSGAEIMMMFDDTKTRIQLLSEQVYPFAKCVIYVSAS